MARSRARVRIELNSATHRKILRGEADPRVTADLERRAQAMVAAAGEGFEVTTNVGSNRVAVSARTATVDARRAEAVDKVLTRAVDRGRG